MLTNQIEELNKCFKYLESSCMPLCYCSHYLPTKM